jgi:hypothetical protein
MNAVDYPEIQFLSVRRFKGAFFLDAPDMMTLFWIKHVESADWFCPDKECVVSIVLDTLFQVKAFHLVAIGTLNQVVFEPREILRPAVAVSGTKCLVLHNHPSGDASPSDDDVLITWRLIRAGQILGIPMVDHVVIGDNCHYSFREKRPDLFGSSSQRDACWEEKNCSRSLSALNI